MPNRFLGVESAKKVAAARGILSDLEEKSVIDT